MQSHRSLPLPRRRPVLRGLAAAALLGATLAVVAGPPLLQEPIRPVPLAHGQDPAKADLGRRLFHDTRLSANGTVSCASCHPIAGAGADGRARSTGFSGLTAFNTPTVFNAALNFRQFWDGRSATLEAQVEAVVQNPVEMGARWTDVVARLARDPSYKDAFAAAYRDGVTAANIQNAIASYERTLITPSSRFDRYLRGEDDALTPQERQGYARFKQYGCVACHQGVNVGGNMFQKFGVMADVPGARAEHTAPGRFAVTGNPADRQVFKVPSLRNVALTAPYFHDGSAATLEQAVDVMFRYQLGRTASAADKEAIVRFLHTLSARPLEQGP